MSIVYLLLPASLLLAVAALIGYIWATRSGQFDDLDTPSLRILNDEAADSSAKDKEGSAPIDPHKFPTDT